MSIYQRFCTEVTDENGALKKITLHYPDNFNFGYDVVDVIAKETPDKRAIVWCNTENEEHIFSFEDVRANSNKMANVFKNAGIGRGDRVMLVLKKHYEYWFAAIALHKLGAVMIPATHMLTVSDFVYRIKDTNTFVSYNLKNGYDTTSIHVDVNIVSNDILDIEAFKKWRPEFTTAEFILEDGKYVCGWAVEKMSKSMFNVVNPDDIVERYGADTLRLYEMFLGPLEQSKPWDTNGIDGVHRFLKKLWNLFYEGDELSVKDEEPTKEELKSLHKLIKKVSWDIDNFSFNTSISAFMICINELAAIKSRNKNILENIVILLAPFAPHISEELWHVLGHKDTVCDARWPEFNEDYLKEDVVNYAISFNGKARFTIEIEAGTSREEIEKIALEHSSSARWLEGKTPKKIIVVPNKIVNIVL